MSSVLIIDGDNKFISELRDDLIKDGFKEEDIFCYQTTSKHRALEGIVSIPVQIVILPLHLTEERKFEGFWLANQIRKNRPENILAIVIMSTLADITSFPINYN